MTKSYKDNSTLTSC